jgi:GDP-D-mannose dehydratase
VPYIAQVAIGQRAEVLVYGNDYNTPDGTGVRDYIHITDLAEGHAAALDCDLHHSGAEIINLGTGCGHSVLEMIAAFKTVSGQQINYQIMARRAGDIDSFFADATKAKTLLGWHPNVVSTRWVRMSGDGNLITRQVSKAELLHSLPLFNLKHLKGRVAHKDWLKKLLIHFIEIKHLVKDSIEQPPMS